MSMRTFTVDFYGVDEVSSLLMVNDLKRFLEENDAMETCAFRKEFPELFDEDNEFNEPVYDIVADDEGMETIFIQLVNIVYDKTGIRLDYLTADEWHGDGLGLAQAFPWGYNETERTITPKRIAEILSGLFGKDVKVDYHTFSYFW